MEEKDQNTGALELFRAGLGYGAIDPVELTVEQRRGEVVGNPYIVIPKECKVEDLRSMMLPGRQFHHHFDEVDSFIDFVKYYKEPVTRLYCIESDGRFLGVIDEHPSAKDHKEECRERLMQGTLQLAKTPEWAAWSSNIEKALEQLEFALFLEDFGRYVVEPSSADFLQVALTLEAKKGVNFKSGMRLENGDHKLLFEEDTRATAGVKGTLEIPHDFKIQIKLFHGGGLVELAGKLRYRIQSGQIRFYYKFPGLENIIRAYVSGIRKRIEKETELPAWSMSRF